VSWELDKIKLVVTDVDNEVKSNIDGMIEIIFIGDDEEEWAVRTGVTVRGKSGKYEIE
jgi:Holliday junction resolvase RusA-like endonuclease